MPRRIRARDRRARSESVVHRLHVVAVRVADEGTEVAGVVLGPDAWLVQGFGPHRDRRIEERRDRIAARCPEGEVRLAEAVARLLLAEPEVGELGAVADRALDLHHTVTTERREDGVVEGGAGLQVGALDGDVVDHARQSGAPAAPGAPGAPVSPPGGPGRRPRRPTGAA